ncbi:glutamine-hydrolyzing GMP synthase [Candidatus Roizmanbacteria bacterium RIFCSPLOWO2_01_FULL_38_12]|uniref:GMP synthase [glutamine-hydrolyzing] n=1 Tax=Candidatus Roizmanbacteria bacterium RIFCSPLOWO2_01_FULL_38_12 TaxID=1802061 RepID=A0A1F7IRA2_9BACT|nr:MAG: glutamine-hydrolyzing GMP synthase [Candidatus Roizmanbacteria bacterium RIFCSPLOWO2_01_FULL_38_12]
MIIIVDFGSQTTHLISRRLRELSIETKIIEPEKFFKETKNIKYKGIILSGGPGDVYAPGAPTIDKKIFDLGKPILGICYGQQLMAHLLGGEAKLGKKKEYGPAILTIIDNSPLLDFRHPELDLRFGGLVSGSKGIPKRVRNDVKVFKVWMNHGVEVTKAPKGFKTIGITETISHAAIADESKKQYGIQFHPEVVHTQFGMQMLKNFAMICGLSPKKKPITKDFVNKIVLDIKDSVKNAKVIGALSGGVDSSIACLLVHEAAGKQLTAIYIDSGLMRAGETDELKKVFKNNYKMDVKIIDARDEFLKNLKGVVDPEKKRKIIGKTFIDVFEREAKKLKATFLVQGTIYPDVIESAGTKYAKNIKSHHNVGGLPERMNLMLLEPLRTFYKDEVRAIGKILDLPETIVHRQPFPGPGLAIRIIGEVTKEKLKILRLADKIFRDEIESSGWHKRLWQYLAVLTGIKTTGVRGDNRAYGETIALRALESTDVMSGNFSHIPYEILEKISVRIVTEIPEVNRVLYDITNKPPGTTEWE